MTRLCFGMLCLALAGCSGRMIGNGDDAGREDDAGRRPDAGREDDAGPLPDGGMDAGMDAGPPPPVCDCPDYPTTCTPPTANVPAFTPDADASLGQLFAMIACADTTLQIAMYEGDYTCVTAAIQQRLDDDEDLVVEIVTDRQICPDGECVFDALDASDRVSVVRDTRTAYMHHKFAIQDDTTLWVSSANFSERSFCEDHNNSIVLDDATIVGRYQDVFERMFDTSTFGPVAPEAPTVSADGRFTARFSPESSAGMMPAAWFDALIAAIGAATMRVDVMISAWTRTEISDALIAADARGVNVQVLVSHVYANDAPAQAILAAGIPIRRSEVHDKVLVIDDTVFTGSPNWSENAWDNNENSLRIDDADIARLYREEAERMFAIGRTVEPVSP
jgi:phosphatidylserine/phosphatidylglycerophosphate/cardiolipin synthase-like enzyme